MPVNLEKVLMNKTGNENFRKINDMMDRYCVIIENGLKERWDKFDIKISNSEMYEVIGGLMARQATLSINLAISPQIWNGHVAPLLLRSMVDVYINFAWILLDPVHRSKKYILFGLGQEKLFIEYLKISQQNPESNDANIQDMIKAKVNWLNSQRADFLTEVNVGSWSGLNTRDMAKEANCEDLYKYAYTPFSGCVHNMWQHISQFNLIACNNPLHKYHKVPSITEFYLDPDYVYRSAKYIDKTFCRFDDEFNIKTDTPLPHDWFVKEYNKLFD